LQSKVAELTHKKKMYKSELVTSYKVLKDHKQQIKVMVGEQGTFKARIESQHAQITKLQALLGHQGGFKAGYY